MSTTSDWPEQFEESSESTDFFRQASLIRTLQPSSGRPTGTPFQNRVMDAVSGSEFADNIENGFPVRRHGEQLKIGYDHALAFLGFTEED